MRPFLIKVILHACIAFNLALAGDLSQQTPARYFSQHPHSSHLDPRFSARHKLPDHEQHEAIVRLVRQFLVTMKVIKVRVWLAHGTLLGWHWGGHILPWDGDIDVHVHYSDLVFLAKYHNMTVHPEKKKKTSAQYLLDVNPHYVERSGKKDPKNWIDARFIDTSTGLYVDIAAVSDFEMTSQKGVSHFVAKDGNKYQRDAMLPLRKTKFEMEMVYVPQNSSVILAHKFGEMVLTNDVYNGYKYDPSYRRWKPFSPSELNMTTTSSNNSQ